MPDFAAPTAAFFEALANQWNALLRFQESFAIYYKDLWEQWAARFAGGVPIDR